MSKPIHKDACKLNIIFLQFEQMSNRYYCYPAARVVVKTTLIHRINKREQDHARHGHL